MPFAFTDAHLTDFYHHGFTVFRGIVPPSLITDLRTAAERVREISARQRGPNVARSPSVGSLAEELDPQPFRDYVGLPPLVDAVRRVLTPEHDISDLNSLSIFLTHLPGPLCGGWHRDISENDAGIDAEDWKVVSTDPTFFAQINCPLYADSCLWYVPGSAGRPSTAGEIEAAGPPDDGGPPGARGRLINPDLVGKSYAEAERLCLEHCERMPGAVNLHLEAGDFTIYRPHGWHNGNYAPHRLRMTLLHTAWSPKSRAWFDRWQQRRAAMTKPAAAMG
jgi:hypothetical protein